MAKCWLTAVIYTATDLKVGLFKGYRSVLITLTRGDHRLLFSDRACRHVYRGGISLSSTPCTASALHLGSPVYPPPERLKHASSIRITLSCSSSGQREAIACPLRAPWVMPPQRPQTKPSAKGGYSFIDRGRSKRSQPCLPWLLANLPAIETGRPLMIGRDNVPWNALKYLPDTLSECALSRRSRFCLFMPRFPHFGLVEETMAAFAQPVINSAKRRDQCAKFTPMSYL